MEKKYHVFISSTYKDLQEERLEALQALLGMGYIVSGMEHFPAIDLDQFEYIKKQIDDCDYYILLIAGKYGSISPSGVGYTELEYEYAVEKGMPVIALIHKDPSSIPMKYCESEPANKEKLHLFREKVCTGRVVKFWSSKEEIGKHVLSAMVATTNMFPAIGWVRANKIANAEALNEIIVLRKMNTRLEQKIKKLEEKISFNITELASLDDEYVVDGEVRLQVGYAPLQYKRYSFQLKESWESIFFRIAEELRSAVEDELLGRRLVMSAFGDACPDFEEKYERHVRVENPVIPEPSLHTIIAQFQAHGLIKPIVQNGRRKYILTDLGDRKLLERFVVKKKHV